MNLTIPPYTVGIDAVSNEIALPDGAVKDAVNVDFDREGRVARRPAMVQVSATAAHSLWRSPRTGETYGVLGDEIVRITRAGVEPLYQMPASLPLCFADLRDRVVASHPSWAGQILPDGSVSPLGIEDFGLGGVTAAGAGGLRAGRYGVAASFLRDNEEGPVSPLRFATIEEGGGLQVQGVPTPSDDTITGVRLYRTEADGDVLYRAGDIPAGMTSHLIGSTDLGRAADTQHLKRMPPGRYVRYWRGRLLTARGRTVYISEPMRYGLHSPRHGFVHEARPIRMLRPVEGGVFVGTDAGVVFYSGSAPDQWNRVVLGAEPPIPGTDELVAAGTLSARFELGDTQECAFWLSTKGFVIGTADGGVVQPQERRARLTGQRGRTAIVGRRAITVVQ